MALYANLEDIFRQFRWRKHISQSILLNATVYDYIHPSKMDLAAFASKTDYPPDEGHIHG